jgi:hypothetical protein
MADEELKQGGSIIKRDPEESVSLKSQFFNFLDIDLDRYKEVEYTKDEAIYIKQRMQHLSTGSAAALPLMCKGPQCPFVKKCPFVAIDEKRQADWEIAQQEGMTQFSEPPELQTPVGKHCLVEVNLLNEWTRLYIFEFDVDENSFVDLSMCRELAEIEVMLWRINNGLSKEDNAELIQETVVGTDRDGTPLTRKEMNTLVDVRERMVNRKSKLVKLMVGDRQEKYKREAALKTREEKDPSTSAAQLRNKITLLLKDAETKVLQLQEKEGNVIDVPYQEDSPKEETITPESLIDAAEPEE